MPVGFGKNIRKSVRIAESKSKASYICPACSRKTIRRKAAGLWNCKKCGKSFASSAYEFKS